MAKSSFADPGHLPLLLYDGHCALCNSMVQRIVRYDKKQRFHFAPLVGPSADGVRAAHPEVAGTDSLILVEESRIHTRSNAAIRSIELLGGVWLLVSVLRIFPRFIRDWVYDGIARIRYRWFGRYETCPLPPPEWRDRFLQ